MKIPLKTVFSDGFFNVTHTFKCGFFTRNAADSSGFNPFYMETQDKNIPTEGVADDSSQELAVDYKAELELAQKRAQEAEEKLSKAEFTLKKRNIQSKELPPDQTVDLEELERRFEEKLESRISAVRAVESIDDVDDVLSLLSEDPDEKALIKHIYDNRIAKTGYSRSQIRDDLEAAQMLANAKKFKKINTELEASLAAKASLGTVPMGSNLKKTEVKEKMKTAFTQGDLAYMKSRGWSEDMIKKAAENILREQNQ
jgi:hypothetical protein